MSSDWVVWSRGLSKCYPAWRRPSEPLLDVLWPRRRARREGTWAVRGIDLEVQAGETVGVVGRNGCGKSTLLQMLCGTLEPSEGEIRVRGRVAPLLELGAGFNRDFTGRENVRMNGAVLGLEPRQIEERLESVLAFADIGPFVDRPVRTYSSGMFARLAFAVAIHVDPDLLVVDEILAVGDEAFQRKCFSRIDDMRSRGAAILFVSHSAGSVVELCDRALLLDRGERLLTADPKAVIARYQRLLYAPSERADAIRGEIRAIDCGQTPAAEAPPAGERATEEAAPAPEDEGSFDADFRSESRVEYEAKGARIREPRIVDSQGREVNVLRARRRYTYAYEVDFDEPAAWVRFGMMIKSVTGIELAGQASHPWRRGIEVERGSTAHVRFHFRTLLVPGVYFLNAGVLAFREGEEYLHRILDALVFRVEPEARPGRITGTADLSGDEAPEVELEPSTG